MQAKSKLYGRRIRGDIGPLGIDPRTRLPGAILGPAVSLTGADQYYDEASDDPQFTLGSRMVVDERVFHYARAGNDLDCGLGAHVGFQQDIGGPANVAADAEAGDYTLIVTVGGGDGRRLNGTILQNELVGGYIIIFTAAMTTMMNRRIVANTAVVGAGGPMTVTLDRPLSVDLALATDHAELMASRYLDVLEGNLDRQMIVGMPPIAATPGQYLWLQTWGPLWGTPVIGDWATFDSSLVMFRGNGSIAAFNEADPAVGIQQIAGTVITPGIGGGQGAPFINLMIAP